MIQTSIGKDNLVYDLKKIAEPFQGVLHGVTSKPLYQRFTAYLSDLRREGLVDSFRVTSGRPKTEDAIVYRFSIKLADGETVNTDLSVATFTYPWTRGWDKLSDREREKQSRPKSRATR